jgi:hypothetical protein
MIRKCLAVGIILLFIGTAAATMKEPSSVTCVKTKAIIEPKDTSGDQIELHYYDPNTITYHGGFEAPPSLWKEAIRLTQTELAPYKTWNITQVVIGFGEDYAEGPMNVTIYIYAKGTATHPGSVIVHDTWAILNGTQLITVPLITPVSLSPAGREEVWVAVEWNQTHWMLPDYAFLDGGPAVRGKGDWIYYFNEWSELYSSLDANWALGAVVEGQPSILGIGTIKGPLGIRTEIQNTGDTDAYNVYWSIRVDGGIQGHVNERTEGTVPILPTHTCSPIGVPMFIGFGKITFQIYVYALNAEPILTTKSAFLFGPFVIRVR